MGSLNQQPEDPTNGGAITDEQAYMKKLGQLTKYIEPLKNLITKMENENMEKTNKMKKLLEVLSNPQVKVPFDTLLKCEIVLQKVDLERRNSSVPSSSASYMPSQEPHAY